MADDKENLFPSTAHLHPVTREYVPDPLNQLFAFQNTQPHDNGQREHITSCFGYCKHGVLGGCAKDGRK